ncbi:hypothetical protein P12x_003277 [Tundrisphaera lichenicola]|uniref:hypothetical protein n=1 Tax=Tundrisphaera lichenicola TaxID=2029860 RepID=UPI003EB73463
MGLLGRARSMMQSWSGPPPVPEQSYSVACPEGHRLRGMRTEGYQALRCPTCGEGIFVLPRSPLPEPIPPATTARPSSAAIVDAYPEDEPLRLTDPSPMTTSTVDLVEEVEPEVEIDWVDEGPVQAHPPSNEPSKADEPSARPVPPSRSARPRPAQSKPRTAPIPPKPAPPVVARLPRSSPKEWAWRNRNALLVAGVILLVVGAIGIRLRRQRLEELPRIAEIGRTEGLRKLDEGEFHAAKKLLADAASAVDGLGGRYEGAESIRQGAREAAIFTDLVPETLDRLLEEAATYRDVDAWPSHFAGMYRGRSIILDAPIVGVPDPSKPDSTYQIECRIYFGRGTRPEGKARIDLSGFQLFEETQPKLGDQLPFGARLASLALDPATNEWAFTFEPDSGVYITHPRALEAIGWPSFDPSEEPPL